MEKEERSADEMEAAGETRAGNVIIVVTRKRKRRRWCAEKSILLKACGREFEI